MLCLLVTSKPSSASARLLPAVWNPTLLSPHSVATPRTLLSGQQLGFKPRPSQLQNPSSWNSPTNQTQLSLPINTPALTFLLLL